MQYPSTTYGEWTITIKPNVINASRLNDDGYLESRSFIGYDVEDIKAILEEENA